MPAFMMIAMAPALLTLIKMMQSLGGGGR
jgi:hypothetical protein